MFGILFINLVRILFFIIGMIVCVSLLYMIVFGSGGKKEAIALLAAVVITFLGVTVGGIVKRVYSSISRSHR